MTTVAITLAREIELISRFLEILNKEQEALKKGDPAALPPLGEAKTVIISELNSVEDQRNRLIGSTTGSTGRSSMAAWLSNNSQTTHCSELWGKLLELASEAKRMHELNGQLLAMHLRKTGDALAILTKRNQENTIYSSDGQTTSYTGSRIVDSA